MQAFAAKYDDSGVTDAITKYHVYVSSKTFTPSDITKWVSTIEHAWAGWRNTVTDPDLDHIELETLTVAPTFVPGVSCALRHGISRRLCSGMVAQATR